MTNTIIKKNKTTQKFTIAQREQKAQKLVSSGEWLNHIGSARPAKSIKYKTGQLVRSIDPWKPSDHKLTFIQSLRWEGGGGYLVMDRTGRLFTTTNISK